MAFPLPSLLSSIEDLLDEVQWLDGMILVTDSQKATFVSFSQVDPVLRRLRSRPRGAEVAEKLCMSLLETHGKAPANPFWFFRVMEVSGWALWARGAVIPIAITRSPICVAAFP